MGNKGQLQISFGMIFSIIIIIATLAVSGYVIYYFVNLSNCTNVGLFYKSIEERVNEAWNSPITRSNFEANIPGGVKYVCFGNLSLTPRADSREQFENLVKYRSSGANMFLYPVVNPCGNYLPNYKLDNAQAKEFFCLPVKSGKINIVIQKDSMDSKVWLLRP